MDGSHRLHDLERRLQFDPSPFVLTQLADEYRRAGRLTEAVNCCRKSLLRHPAYHSARLILARALVALARQDEAASEYEQVVAQAPDNLAAARELAEICEKQGRPGDALTYYRRAFVLARNDKSIEAAIERLSTNREEPSAVPAAPQAPATHAVLPNARQVDFDAVLSLLGRPHQQPPPLTERLLSDPASLIPAPSPTAAALEPPAPAGPRPADDALATLERDLRDRFSHDVASFPTEAELSATSTAAVDAARIESAVITALEAWLDAIARDRHRMRQP